MSQYCFLAHIQTIYSNKYCKYNRMNLPVLCARLLDIKDYHLNF